jgi:NADPH:quinone reductase-like Zn-dependent oxidoreductase
VRTDVSGRHYTSTQSLPMMPGIDEVGRLPDGRRVYFVVPDEAWGSMAERAVIDPQRVVALPDSVEAAKVAAAMNPAMSSWVALRRRVPLQPGQSVLVLGATRKRGSHGGPGSQAPGRRPSGWRGAK